MYRAPSSAFAVAVLAVASVAVLAAVPDAQAPLAIPTQADVAVGTVKAGATSVTLKFAYAAGPIDSFGRPIYQVVLTDAPIVPAAMAKELAAFGGAPLLRGGKLSGITMTIGLSGAGGVVQNMVPFVGPDLRGSKMLSSVSLTSFAVKAGRVTGQGAQALDDTGQGWSYSASWNATLRAPAK